MYVVDPAKHASAGLNYQPRGRCHAKQTDKIRKNKLPGVDPRATEFFGYIKIQGIEEGGYRGFRGRI